MTEEEAAKKWCPFARQHNRSGAYNRSPPENKYANPVNTLAMTPRCVASACMAWRETKEAGPTTGMLITTGGYCGLARKP